MSADAVYSIVTDQIVAMLEAGTVPWRKPWNAETGLPRSMSTGKPYRGANVFLLGVSAAIAGYSSPWWGTYKRIAELGGQVRKGEKSSVAVFWKRATRKETDEATGERTERTFYLLRYYRVFNADQADGVPAKFGPPAIGGAVDIDPIDACDQIVAGYADGPTIGHGGPAAFYSPARDHVQLPDRSTFASAETYYSTAFHELTHSTGHPSRLAREGIVEGHRFGDAVYSREELVAEMGAAMLCGLAGIEQVTLPNSAAYIASWLKVLRGDSKLVVAAAGAAQRACDRITGATFAEPSEPVLEPATA